MTEWRNDGMTEGTSDIGDYVNSSLDAIVSQVVEQSQNWN